MSESTNRRIVKLFLPLAHFSFPAFVVQLEEPG